MRGPHIGAFTKAIQSIDPSKSRREVFTDFCELAFCALAKVASPSEQQREDLEQQYMEVVARYRNKDDVRRMPELLGIAIEALNGGGIDFLGSVAGELDVLDAKLGQFFTPYHVSRCMAEITLSDVAKTIEENGFVTVQEPAVGAGGMVIAVADVIEDLGYSPETHLWVEATELSRATFHMGFIQINARGVAGRVINGNSISMEVFTSAYTAAAPIFYAVNGDPFAKQKAQAEAAAQRQAERDARQNAERAERLKHLGTNAQSRPPEQLGLFD